jgi:serine protease AprX
MSEDYYVLGGSSMAAPIVTGTISLMLEKDPRLSPDTIKARLMKTQLCGGYDDGCHLHGAARRKRLVNRSS